jgi:hypothetical protein
MGERMGGPSSDVWNAVRAILRRYYEVRDIETFQQQFFSSQTMSIDEFVQNRKEFDLIARRAIAAFFLYGENGSLLDGDWYPLFRRTLLRNGPELTGDHCAIITFNYERSLEVFLWRAIQYTFGLQEGIAYRHVQQLPIHHVYGSLGELRDGSKGEVVPFGSTDPAMMSVAADSLRLMPPRTSPTAETIRDHVSRSDILCFLGFGFWTDNFELIADSIRPSCHLYASNLRLPRTIVERVTKRFPEMIWGAWTAEQCFLNWNLFP